MTKSVVLLSGGLDSSTLLYHLADHGPVRAVSVNYGQRHRKELAAAEQIAAIRGVPFDLVDLSSLASLLPGSALTDDSVPVPDGHYAAESMKATVVPNRNMVLLSIAAAIAIAHNYDQVAYAAHSGDHTIYPDCRPEFARALGDAIALADWSSVRLASPFIDMSKADICKLAEDIGVPLASTWSCYKGAARHCGTCGTCVERKEAFEQAGIPDNTLYQA